MEDDSQDNKIVDGLNSQEYEYKYNFINNPWDYRSMKSKIGIIALLLTIFIGTMACVIHNLIMHYAETSLQNKSKEEIKCHLVKMNEYPYAARIHSAATHELLCLGAVISTTSVLANGVCVKSGPVRLRLGSFSDPRCKREFTVDAIEPIVHQGAMSKHLVLLTTYENMSHCGRVVSIGETLLKDVPVDIIGRPLRSGRSFSHQPANLVNVENTAKTHAVLKNTICVAVIGKCPVRAGDLLVQDNYLFGLASTSTHFAEHNKAACFADLRVVYYEIKSIET